jgi:hypothetical protein
MARKTVKNGRDVANAIWSAMQKQHVSQYALAGRLAPELGIGQHAVEQRLRRVLDNERIDFDFASAVARELGLTITIEE